MRIGFEHMEGNTFMEEATNIGPLINTLIKMKNIFDMCNVPSDGNELERAIPKTLLISFTKTEEGWLRNQFTQFQNKFLSVEPPSGFFQELLSLLTTGEQVSESFVASWIQMYRERSRRILKLHPEFLALTDSEQVCLWNKKNKTFIALAAAQGNMVKTGKSQLKGILGYLDKNETSWESQFENVIDLKSLQQAFLYNYNVSHGKLDNGNASYLFELMKDVEQMVSNDQLFQLFFVIALLDTEGLPNSVSFSQITKMRHTYMQLFQRKMMAAGCSYVDYAKFRNTMRKAKIVASILEDIFF